MNEKKTRLKPFESFDIYFYNLVQGRRVGRKKIQ